MIRIHATEPLQDTEDVWEIHIVGVSDKTITTMTQDGVNANTADIDVPIVKRGEPFIIARFTIHKPPANEANQEVRVSNSTSHAAASVFEALKFRAAAQAVAAVGQQPYETVEAAKRQCIRCAGQVVLALT